jgi:hypothetical protein
MNKSILGTWLEGRVVFDVVGAARPPCAPATCTMPEHHLNIGDIITMTKENKRRDSEYSGDAGRRASPSHLHVPEYHNIALNI